MQDETTKREPTKGERLAGVSFNPPGDAHVTKLKALYAEIIDELDAYTLLTTSTANHPNRSNNLNTYSSDSQMA